MISDKFVILAALFNLYGIGSYAFSTLKGQTKPNRVTWFLWALAPLIAFSAEINQGVGLRSLMTFMVGFGPALVLLASFMNKKSVWRLTTFDFVCGGLSLLGLALWALTREGNIAIIFSIVADGLAALPTVVKAYTHPETENYIIFFFGAISAAITILTINNWTFANYGFPIYILVICFIIAALVKFRIGRRIMESK